MASQWCLRAVYQRPQRQVSRKGEIFSISGGSLVVLGNLGSLED